MEIAETWYFQIRINFGGMAVILMIFLNCKHDCEDVYFKL